MTEGVACTVRGVAICVVAVAETAAVVGVTCCVLAGACWMTPETADSACRLGVVDED